MSKVKLNKYLKDIKPQVKTGMININGEEIPIEYKITLTSQEYLQLVYNVCNSVFDADENRYNPELLIYYFYMYGIEAYTNIEFPDDFAKSYSVFIDTDIYVQIENLVGKPTFNLLFTTIKEKLEYMTAKKLSESKVDELIDSLIGVINSASSLFTDDIKDVIGKLAQVDKIEPETLVKTIMDIQTKQQSNVVELPVISSVEE